MTDYIKREDAIKAFDPRQRRDWYTPWIVETLKDLPSTDVAPVVRCKNCKHRYITGSTTHYYVCDFMDAEYNDNGYCHHGERKDDDN